jgi:hypothetical protein
MTGASKLILAAHERSSDELLEELQTAVSSGSLAVDTIARLVAANDPRGLARLEDFASWAVGISRLAMMVRLARLREMKAAALDQDGAA